MHKNHKNQEEIMSCVVKEWLPVAKVQEEYKKKLVTADEAVKIVKSGDYLHYGLFTGVVVDLDTALGQENAGTRGCYHLHNHVELR